MSVTDRDSVAAENMGNAAVKLAKCRIRKHGTIEFLVDADRRFYVWN